MLRRYRLALALWICGVVMVFVAFISASIVRRGIPVYESSSGAYSTQSESLPLPTPLLILDSGVLAASSISLELARHQSRGAALLAEGSALRSARWGIYSAIVLGLAFLAGQAMVWRLLQSDGLFMSTNARVAFFYLLIGAHSAQIAIGLLALIWIAARQSTWTAIGRYIAVDLSTWYFAAMTVLWMFLFCFLVFA